MGSGTPEADLPITHVGGEGGRRTEPGSAFGVLGHVIKAAVALCILGTAMALSPVDFAFGWTTSARTGASLACVVPGLVIIFSVLHFRDKAVESNRRGIRIEPYGGRFLLRTRMMIAVGFLWMAVAALLLGALSGSLRFEDFFAATIPAAAIVCLSVFVRRKYVKAVRRAASEPPTRQMA